MSKVCLLIFLAAMLVASGCRSYSGSRDYVPGRGWVPSESVPAVSR